MRHKCSAKVAIIDYEMSNLFSVRHACEYIGLTPIITNDAREISQADAAILPGVGAFGEAMRNLHRLDLVTVIKDTIDAGKPFMGICLGLQVLLTESEEFGSHKGMNIIEGVVKKFPAHRQDGTAIKIPQIAWNQIARSASISDFVWKQSPLAAIRNHEYMYFVHSYYVNPVNPHYILTTTRYEGYEYCSSMYRENLFAVQFHPEKSGAEGLKIYDKWAETVTTMEKGL